MSKTTDVIVDAQGGGRGAQQQREMPMASSLVSWVMTRVRDWEDHRKQNYDERWKEYWRMWRGFWSQQDKSRDSERSRLIHPALSQAVDSTVADLEQAVFGQGNWFDVSDDYNDEDKTDIAMWRDQMEEDLEKEDVESAMSEIFLNGALCGTGIGKITLHEREEKRIVPKTIGDSDVLEPTVEVTPTIRVGLTAVDPFEFVIDPSARTVNDGLGCAHITTVPKHSVQRKMTQGIYRKVSLAGYNDTFVGETSKQDRPELKDLREEDKTMIIEYHGFVPKRLLEGVASEYTGDEYDEAEEIVTDDDETLVEAIVTIANSGTLLRAVENPYLMGDRCFLAYQHDIVPNKFWGRGVCEKGYNPQKGLDAELRGRIDAMALSIHPMMAMDATRLHRGSDLRVAPGKNILTNGSPRDILMPFQFGQVNPTTFSQSADLERQVQMATGAMDSATPIGDNRRNETLGGMSMIQGASVKRTRRTLAAIERKFIKPFIHKAAWRFMQFAPNRYPVEDIQFVTHSTLGIMARELEQNQLANMMKTVPAESPAFWMLLKGIFEHSDISIREEMLPMIDFMMKQSLQKQANPQPDPLVQIKLQELELRKQLETAEIQRKTQKDSKDAEIEVQRLMLQLEEIRRKEREMILEAKLQLAEQEQDSLVTAVQMSQKESKDQMDMILKMQQEAAKNAGESKAPQVININGEKATLAREKAARRKVKITRTPDGLEGRIEEEDGDDD